MSDNESPVASSIGKTEGGCKSLEFHDYEKEYLKLLADTTATGYKEVVESKQLITLQEWNTICRIVTFLFSLAAFCSIYFDKQAKVVLVNETDHEAVTFYCKEIGSVMFVMYVNLAVSAHSLLLLVVFAFLMRRQGTGEKTPASVLWPAFVLSIISVSFSLLGFAASALGVLTKIRTSKFCSSHDFVLNGTSECIVLGSFCSTLEPALAASLVAYASFLAGTCIDGYCIILKPRSLGTVPLDSL